MRTLTQSDCLALWERGRTLHPIDQGLLAVQTAFPESRDESVADWPLGRRNRALAELYHASFNRTLRGWTRCEHCGEKLEFEFDSTALAESSSPAPDSVSIGSHTYRLPTSRDLAQLAAYADPGEAARRLFEQCRLTDDGPEEIDFSADEIETAEEQLALADPAAEVLLHFDCPVCGASFDECLELATFLWSALESRAKHLLLEVHTLASAYGWSEGEVLALTPARREFYMEMVRA